MAGAVRNAAITASKEAAGFADWYRQILLEGEMISYYDVSGCYILRPAAMSIWKSIQTFFGGEIAKLGVEDVYFPTFIRKETLEKEASHVAGFSPEVAWITKSGNTDLEEPLALRPTSETVMYPTFAKWIRSHRDLPLKINQWCNIVRWEFSNPTPFIRTREFLWQEGHTAWSNEADAWTEVRAILNLYRRVFEELLAVPVVPGRKTEYEKFAGGDATTSVEAYIPIVGRGCQGATSHYLGQNFAKMFDITFQDHDMKTTHAHQNSWGLSTRTIGVCIMVHSDNKGLVIPPKVAPLHVIVVPCGITTKTSAEDKENIFNTGRQLVERLNAAGIKSKIDLSDDSPGAKFAVWEVRGVCLRVEVGPKDLAKKQFVYVRRDNGAKATGNLDEIEKTVQEALNTQQHDMFERARQERDSKLRQVTNWADFTPALNERCIVLSPCCDSADDETEVKKRSKAESEHLADKDPTAPSMGAKSLCIPFDQPAIPADCKCIIHTDKPATRWILYGRSY